MSRLRERIRHQISRRLKLNCSQWGLDPNTVQKNLVAQLVTLGCGAITTVALSNYFGRLPILFYFQIIALATGIWNAAATTFPSYLAGRAINGFFSIVAQAVSRATRPARVSEADQQFRAALCGSRTCSSSMSIRESTTGIKMDHTDPCLLLDA